MNIFCIHNRNLVSVENQISQFENGMASNETFDLQFFPEYFLHTPTELNLIPYSGSIERGVSALQQKYLSFLEKYASRIENVLINLSKLYLDPLPYYFLGQCLSKLTHVKNLKIMCIEDHNLETEINFAGLGQALNQLSTFDYLTNLDLHIPHLVAREAIFSDDDAFIHFIRSCTHLQSFGLYSNSLHAKLIHGIIDVISSHPELIDAQININPNYFYSLDNGFHLPHLGKLFQNKSVTNLSITLSGNIYFSQNLSIQEQLIAFSKHLDIVTSLKSFYFNITGVKFPNYTDDLNIIYSIDAFTAISHNKSLETLTLDLHKFCFEIGNELILSQFINNFKNSNMQDLNFSEVHFKPWDNLIILNLIESITQENLSLKESVIHFKNQLSNTDLSNKFNGSYFQHVYPETIHQMDVRLYRVDLRVAHQQIQQHSQILKFDDFRLYLYFCKILSLNFNQNITSPFILMEVLSYLDQRDLSQLIQLNMGILEYVCNQTRYCLEHRIISTDMIYQIGIQPRLKSFLVPPTSQIVSNGLVNQYNLNDMRASGLSIAALLTTSPDGRMKLTNDNYNLAKSISSECLNAIITEKGYVGISVAYGLAASAEGQMILEADDYRLARLISAECLNTIVKEGEYADFSVAFGLAQSAHGCSLLAANNYELAKLISAECLNTIVKEGEYAGFSVAFSLAYIDHGYSILAADDYYLASLITAECLNRIIPQGQNAGVSLAFCLATKADGIAILAAGDYHLASLINAECLNSIIPHGQNAGLSLAFFLTTTVQGQMILEADDYRLARLISAECLNTVITQGPSIGKSVAFYLAAKVNGTAILSADNYRLASLITAECLNRIIPQGQNAGVSLAFCLATKADGIAILAADNYRLASLITAECLNSIIPHGQNAGLSLAFFLTTTVQGEMILEADDYRLARLISAECLNTVITQGPSIGKSVAFYLVAKVNGIAILSADNYRLAKNINRGFFSTIFSQSPFCGESPLNYLRNKPGGNDIINANASYNLVSSKTGLFAIRGSKRKANDEYEKTSISTAGSKKNTYS